ncbi:MAG: hypothetical protein K8R36_14350, partial [Planctomycetales bacterium]|nr:hypothetical protein [Planctomycetales bacterium]
HHHPAQHHAALRPHFAQLPHRSSHHHRGGYHRGGYHHSGGVHVNYYRGYHRTGYYRHRGNRNSQMAWMARMYQQQYQMMVRQRQAELKAFLAAFDTNHNGVIDGKEMGPAEKYLRERRLGKIPPLAIASANRGKK